LQRQGLDGFAIGQAAIGALRRPWAK